MEKHFFKIAMICIGISIISLFLPTVTYVEGGKKLSYSLYGLIINSKSFEDDVLMRYKGPIIWNITGTLTIILAIIFIAAFLCAVISLFTLRAQYPNTVQFVLTIVGLIGVSIPSFILIIGIAGYGKYFIGKIRFGIAPVITIISMVVCIFAVKRRKDRVAVNKLRQLEAEGKIWKAGDL